MLEWSAPTAIIEMQRQQNFYSETDVTVDADFSSLDNKNSVTISYLCQAVPITGQTTPADVSGTLSDNVQDTIILDNLFSWNITITVTDAFGGSTSYTAFIAVGVPFVYFDRYNSSLGINVIPTHEKAFEINGDIYISGVKIVDLIYPVGSIYISTSATNPAVLFGGTWSQIKDAFLLSAGDTYTAGDTGGTETVTLTEDEIPAHGHYMGAGAWSGNAAPLTSNASNALFGPYDYGTNHTGAKNSKTQNAGGGQAHNNMPPYLVVYVWQRTA